MPKRSIGIDFNNNRLRAVQLAREGDRFRVEKAWSAPMRRQSDKPEDLLRRLIAEQGFDRRAAFAVALPHRLLHYQYETEYQPAPSPCPDNLEMTAIDESIFTRNNDSPRLTTCIPTVTLDKCLQPFKENRLRCEIITSPAAPLLASLKNNRPDIVNQPAILLFADEKQSLILIADMDLNVIRIRNFPNPRLHNSANIDASALVREIRLTWQAAFHETLREDTPMLIAGRLADNKQLKVILADELTCRIVTLENLDNLIDSNKFSLDHTHQIAGQLAHMALSPDTKNKKNLKNRQIQSNKPVNTRRHLVFSTVLTGCTAFMYLFSLLLNQHQMEGRYKNLKSQCRQIFTQTLPHETVIVDEVSQMQQRAQTLKKELDLFGAYSNTSCHPLDLLVWLSANTPADMDLSITQCDIQGHTIRLKAVTTDHKSPYRWEQHMWNQPDIAGVEIIDPRRDKDTRKVSFEAEILFTQEDK